MRMHHEHANSIVWPNKYGIAIADAVNSLKTLITEKNNVALTLNYFLFLQIPVVCIYISLDKLQITTFLLQTHIELKKKKRKKVKIISISLPSFMDSILSIIIICCIDFLLSFLSVCFSCTQFTFTVFLAILSFVRRYVVTIFRLHKGSVLMTAL